MRVVLSFLCLMVVTSLQAKEASDVEDIVILANERPIFVRLHLRIEGKSHREAWDGFLRFLYTSLDRDRDGVLSKAEADNMPTPSTGQPASTSRMFLSYFITKDPNEDGKISFEEMKSYYDRKGSTAFRLQSNDPRQVQYLYYSGGSSQPTASEVNKAILSLIDTNKDGKLSAKELERAEPVLLKNDFDDDEMLSNQEVTGQSASSNSPYVVRTTRAIQPTNLQQLTVKLISGKTSGPLVKRLLETYSPKKTSLAKYLTRKDVGLDQATFNELDLNGDKKLDRDELEKFGLRKPDLEVTINQGKKNRVEILKTSSLLQRVKIPQAELSRGLVSLGVTELSFQVGPARRTGTFVQLQAADNQFNKAQFEALDQDNNGYLDRMEARRNGFFSNSFNQMDADKDGKVFLKEMLAYAKATKEIRERSQRSCISLSITEEDQGLFGLIDRNGDKRLSVREIREAVHQIKKLDRNKDQQLELSEIPRRFRLGFEKGPSLAQGASYYAVTTMASPDPVQPGVAKGPGWFQKMDRNHDGDVSPREFLGKPEIFAKIDTDGDKLISAEEAEKAAALFKRK